MLRQFVLALPALFFLAGCEAESGSLPVSKSLTPEKVASIAETIKTKYPNLSSEMREKVLNTVVQSIDNMVFVEGGQFDMGDFGWACEYDETDVCTWPCGQEPEQLCHISSNGDDDFVHPVKLNSYYFSKFQVSLGDFDLFFIANGKPQFDVEKREREDLKFRYQRDLPAFTKTWQESKDYCHWIANLSGYSVDLPTEAQWEFAARNRGQHILFPTDTGSLSFGENYPVEGGGRTFSIAKFPPSPLGIYSLAGNATDWVNDWYGEDYYRQSPVVNPQGPEKGTYKVKRGSYYPEGPMSAASVVRRWPDKPEQEAYYPGTGFRCAIQSGERLR